MRVLMVLPVDARGRMAAVLRQISSITALGIDVDVLEVRGRRRLKYLETLPGLARRSRAADLIHAHYGYCGWLACLNVRKPTVISFMGSDLLGVARADGTMTRSSKSVVSVNKAVAKLADAVIVKSLEMGETLSVRKVHVIPNGVDTDAFAPIPRATALAALGWEPGRRVLFPGCPDEARKGHPLAAAAVAQAARLLGEPIELVPLCGVDGRVVPLYVNACDALLMTSFWEGSPNCVKEAMACDVPVVSVPVGDVRQLIGDVRGCAIRERDATELGDALAEILRSGTPSDGRDALRHKELDLVAVAERVAGVYDGVLATAANGS